VSLPTTQNQRTAMFLPIQPKPKLGMGWVTNQRTHYKLSGRKEIANDSLPVFSHWLVFEWDYYMSPGRPFERACRLSQNHGHCNVPTKYSQHLLGYSTKEHLQATPGRKEIAMTPCPYSVIGWLFEWTAMASPGKNRLSRSTTAKSTGTAMFLELKKTQSLHLGEPKGSNRKHLKERSHITPARIQALKAWVLNGNGTAAAPSGKTI
jgi:hypothetical protein